MVEEITDLLCDVCQSPMSLERYKNHDGRFTCSHCGQDWSFVDGQQTCIILAKLFPAFQKWEDPPMETLKGFLEYTVMHKDFLAKAEYILGSITREAYAEISVNLQKQANTILEQQIAARKKKVKWKLWTFWRMAKR